MQWVSRRSNARHRRGVLPDAAPRGAGGNTDAILALLAAGVDADQLEDTHSTALMYAAYHGHRDSVNALLRYR